MCDVTYKSMRAYFLRKNGRSKSTTSTTNHNAISTISIVVVPAKQESGFDRSQSRVQLQWTWEGFAAQLTSGQSVYAMSPALHGTSRTHSQKNSLCRKVPRAETRHNSYREITLDWFQGGGNVWVLGAHQIHASTSLGMTPFTQMG
jgi:hypothetical protein